MLYKNDMFAELLDEDVHNDVRYITEFDNYADDDQSGEHILRFIFETTIGSALAVMHLVERTSRKYFVGNRCGHDHDCCGCWMAGGLHVHAASSPIKSVSEFGEEIYHYTVYINWSSYRNV